MNFVKNTLVSLTCISIATASCAKTQLTEGYVLPSDKPVTIIILRPDVKVGSLTTGGVEEPNADWTATSRTNLAKALEANQKAAGNSVKPLADQIGDNAKVVDDYQNLFHAVSNAVLVHKYLPGGKLPTKKDKFDWTLGPGASKLGDVGGGNYALLLYSHDSFGSSGRKAMQAAGLLGCAIGFCMIVSGGIHFYYASLVDLQSGNIVWFNYLKSSAGDIRTVEGSQQLVDSLLSTMPKRAEPASAPKK